MDSKSLHTLELPKILQRLSTHTAFSAGAALAVALEPTTNLVEARRRLQETTEARKLLASKSDVSIGGARDVRPHAQAATRGVILDPGDILDLKNTLIAGRTLKRQLTRVGDAYPRLAVMATRLEEAPGLVEAISQILSDRGDVLDSASAKLAEIRRDLKIAHDRLLDKLNRLLTDSRYALYIQEAIITQRDGRYVIPLKADFKGKIPGVIHDQSASGATLFIEPLSTVDLNNTWRGLQLAEQQEIRRILAELCARIGDHAHAITATVNALADLDLTFAKARYADDLRANEPLLHDFRPRPPAQETTTRTHPGSTLRLRAARHPLLYPEKVVPVDVELDDETYAVVITGPNTGGKTVSLKTVGLLVVMAQCGLHIPAQSGSELSVFERVFADIGDEQSIEQSLSTFSAHITHVIRILKQVNDRTLVILDELGSGTDPGEGSALARAILSYLLDAGATTLVATHYPELKGFAHSTPGIKNASVEFNLETLAPTYRLTIGLPGRSNAFAIATRLGLEASIIAEARSMVGQSDLAVEQLLDEIHRQRDVVRDERARAEAARETAERLERELEDRLDSIERERRKILQQTRQRADKELNDLRAETAELRRKLARLATTATLNPEAQTDLQEAEEALSALADKPILPSAPAPLPPAPRASPKRAVRLGDTVKVKTLGSMGVVTALSSADVEVQVGRLRVRAKLDDVELRGSPQPAPEPEPAPASEKNATLPPSPGLELDIRGQRVEDALPELERYLDAAYRAGLPWARIIHGKGTGKLRQSVREALRANALVRRFATGEDSEGGDGVTVVHFVPLTD